MSWLNPVNYIPGARGAMDKLDDLYKEYLTMDRDTTIPLRNALESIQALMDHHHSTGGLENEGRLIEQVIEALHEIVSSQAPQEIFPNPGIEGAQAQQEFAQRIQARCQPLLLLLRDYNSVGVEKPSAGVIAGKLQEVYGVLQLEQGKQVGPLARGMTFIMHRVEKEYQKRVGQTEQALEARRNIANQHPLIRLLGLLGVYEHSVHLPDRRKIDLYNALFELDSYSPCFDGVLNHVLEDGILPASNDEIFKKISNFLRKKIHHANVLNDGQMNQALLAVCQRAIAVGGIVPDPIRDGENPGKIAWARTYIKGKASPEDEALAGLVATARTESKFRDIALFIFAYRKEKLKHSAKQVKALKIHIFNLCYPHELAAEEATKLTRAQQIISNETVIPHLTPAQTHAIQQGRLAQIQEVEHQINFGKYVIPANALDVVADWPNNPGDRGMAEAMWLAVAHFEDLKQCEQLHQDLREAEGRLTELPKQFEILISILEKEPLLLPDRGVAMLEELSKTILGWVNLAMRSMKDIRGVDEGDIDKKFAQVTQLIAKGRHLEGIRLAQRLVEESPLGLRMWEEAEVASPLSTLEAELDDFHSVSPPRKPPKSSGEVRKRLGIGEEEVIDWDEAWDEVIQSERKKLVSNTCDFSAFNISMQFVLGKSSEARETLYKNLVASLDNVAGENGLYNGHDFTERVRRAISKLTGQFPHEVPDESVEKILIALDQERGAGYDEERMKRELHETLYFSLLWQVMDYDKDLSLFTKLAGHGLLVVIHRLLEFFIRPFSESLLSAIKKDVILSSNGTLTETHLTPVKSLGRALDSYSTAKKAWVELKKEQASGLVIPDPDRTLIGKNEQEAMEIVLDNPLYYHGYDPREIDLEMGYLAVDHFLEVADFCKRIEQWHLDITRNANSNVIEDPEGNFQVWVNEIGKWIKWLFSLIPHAMVYAIHFCLKVFEMLFNFLAKQLAKFAIWKWDIVTTLIDEMTHSLFKESYHTPVIDELVLDQLKELERQILQDSQEERGGLLEHESSIVKRQIREAFANLFEAIEIDSKDTSQEVQDNGLNPTTKWLKIQLKSSLKELLTSLLVVSSQSFLNKEQMNELLLKVLTSANDGLRGSATILKPEELHALTEALGHEPSPAEIERHARDIHGKLQGEIQRRLNNILEEGVNPVISRTVDQGLKGPSDVLLEYAAWMERRLFSYPGKGLASERNIIHMLRDDLHGFMGKTQPQQEDLLRKIHENYTTFIQEFIAKQANVDHGKPIPNALKLNRFIRTNLQPIMRELADQLTEFIRNAEGRDVAIQTIEATLKRLEDKLIEQRETFNKIKRAEQSRVEGMHQGMGGFVQTGLETLKGIVHEEVTPVAQRLLNGQIKSLADHSRGLYQNPVLVTHVIRYQMLGFIEARA